MTDLRQVTETDEFTVEWARRGDIFDAPLLDRTERVMIVSPCEGDLMHAFFCEPCQVNLANVYNLRLHLETPVGWPHRIATWCPKRRVYEAISGQTFREITKEFGEDQ